MHLSLENYVHETIRVRGKAQTHRYLDQEVKRVLSLIDLSIGKSDWDVAYVHITSLDWWLSLKEIADRR